MALCTVADVQGIIDGGSSIDSSTLTPLIAEAGGRSEEQSAEEMLKVGGRVVAAGPQLFDEVVAMADEAFNP